MLKFMRFLFLSFVVFGGLSSSAKAVDANTQIDQYPISTQANQSVDPQSLQSDSDQGQNLGQSLNSQQTQTETPQQSLLLADNYAQFLKFLNQKYNDSQSAGSIAGAAEKSMGHLDQIEALIKENDRCEESSSCSPKKRLRSTFKNSFNNNKADIRKQLEDMRNYSLNNDLYSVSLQALHQAHVSPNQTESSFDSSQNMSSLDSQPATLQVPKIFNIPNSVILPIWMHSVEMHFQKAALHKSAVELRRGIRLLNAVVYQKDTRQFFVFNVEKLSPQPEEQNEQDESRLAKLSRQLDKTQAYLDSVSPLSPIFNGIHKFVTGEEQAARYSQEYWDIRNQIDGKVHGALDAGGMAPVIGEPIDLFNGLLYASKGDAANASLSFGAMIPVVGSAATGGKYVDNVAKAVPTNGIRKRTTVLGKVGDYENLAEDIGGNYLNIPDNIWETWTRDQKWAANKKFLDRAINRGDDIVLATPVKNIDDATGMYKRELEYLVGELGYVISRDGTRLIKP